MELNFADMVLLKYATYEDYLRSFLIPEDKFYYPQKKIPEVLVKLGYRSMQGVIEESEFYRRRQLISEYVNPKSAREELFGKYLTSKDPVLMALKERENFNKKKFLSTIIFIRYRSKGGFEVSSYIDFSYSIHEHNMSVRGATDWQAVFQGRRRLMPKKRHLSFWDLHNKLVLYNNTDNFKVIHDPKHGVMFVHRGDHKIIPTGVEKTAYSKNVVRSLVYSPIYDYVVFYDHPVRRQV